MDAGNKVQLAATLITIAASIAYGIWDYRRRPMPSSASLNTAEPLIPEFWRWLRNTPGVRRILVRRAAQTALVTACLLSFFFVTAMAPVACLAFLATLCCCLVVFCRNHRRRYWWHLLYVPVLLALLSVADAWYQGRDWAVEWEATVGLASLAYAVIAAVFIGQMTRFRQQPPTST